MSKSELVIPLCLRCRHFGGMNDAGQLVCMAFPAGIPKEFLTGAREHRSPVDGDGGVVFAEEGEKGEFPEE